MFWMKRVFLQQWLKTAPETAKSKKKKWWNDKIKQISESTNRREDKEIQLEAAKVLRAENSDF